ncbi:hypothetical protein BDR22DRAFT_847195 [Usnea florida]
MFPILTAVALAIPLLASASASPSPSPSPSLPPCSNIDRPCSCPAGSTFKNITTTATIGASAGDCKDVMNDCEKA